MNILLIYWFQTKIFDRNLLRIHIVFRCCLGYILFLPQVPSDSQCNTRADVTDIAMEIVEFHFFFSRLILLFYFILFSKFVFFICTFNSKTPFENNNLKKKQQLILTLVKWHVDSYRTSLKMHRNCINFTENGKLSKNEKSGTQMCEAKTSIKIHWLHSKLNEFQMFVLYLQQNKIKIRLVHLMKFVK